MRLKAPKGRGHPVLNGVEVKPKDDGCYYFERTADIETLKALGYRDADAREEEETAPSSEGLREAVAATLREFDIAISEASDEALTKALGLLRGLRRDRIHTEPDSAPPPERTKAARR